MNPFTFTPSYTMSRYARSFAGGVGVSIAVLATLFFVEAVPFRGATPEAAAWHCVAMTATPASIEAGQTTTLAWNFAADTGISVTIAGVPGTFDGVRGSVEVQPSETTTYTAVAHKVGTNTTMECSVTVTVTTPPPPPPPPTPEPTAPQCPLTPDADTVVVVFNDTRLVSSGDESKSQTALMPVDLQPGTYTIETVSWDGYNSRTTVTQPNEAWRIALYGAGEHLVSTSRATSDIPDFVREATVRDTVESALVVSDIIQGVRAVHAVYPDTTSPNSVVPICASFTKHTPPPPPPPVVEDPEWPSCPFTSSADTTVISFDGKGLIANGSVADATSSVYPVSLPVGTYTIRTASWDGYATRASAEIQPYEQWFLRFEDSTGAEVARTRATTDIEDGVIESLRVDDPLESSFALTRPVSSFTAVHAKYPFDARNSVQPICMAITTHTPPTPETPLCTMSVTPSSIKKGETARLSWSGQHITGGSIDQAVGTVATEGSQNVSPSNTTTYTGTFTAKDGAAVTCSATLAVRTSGGGGKCLNCDDDDDADEKDTDEKDEEEEEDPATPAIVLSKTITKAGSYITLDQVPYTGFEAGPVATALFWLSVLLASALIAYFVTRVQPITRMRALYASRVAPVESVHITTYNTPYVPVAPRGLSQPTMSASTMTSMRQTVPGVASDDGAGKIESVAHAQNILLSPEATRLIMQALGATHRDVDGFLSELFARVVATYQREDGWILLSQDRAIKLLSEGAARTDAGAPMVAQAVPEEGQYRVDPSLERRTPAVPDVVSNTNRPESVRPVRTETINVDSVVPMFVDLLVAGEQRKAFELLRRLQAENVAPESFVMTVIRKLDDVYKNRLEGNHNPDKDLTAKTATWNTADFEKVLSILVECVDYSYTNNRIGTKVALTKLFEHFSK